MTRVLFFLLFALAPLGATQAMEELLAADEAFAIQAEAVDAATVRVTWTIADGYYMYREKIGFESETGGYRFGPANLPEGTLIEDEFFGRVQTYRDRVQVEIPVERTERAAGTLTFTALSQGCADLGVCYPPHRQQVSLALPPVAQADTPPAATERGSRFGFSLFGNRQEELLEGDLAFALTTERVDNDTLLVQWDIAPGYYLYRDKFSFALEDASGVSLGQVTLPQGKEKEDEFFGLVQIHRDRVSVELPLLMADPATARGNLVIGFQGCADIGVCYPPMSKTVALDLQGGSAGTVTAAPAGGAGGADGPPLSEQDSLAASLASGNTLLVLATFLGLGLLLSFTPCVFPMIPILSSIIVGQGDSITTRKAFIMSLVFVLAMAATYTVAGVIAGLFGANLQATFQNPWILSAFAAIFVLLALSMFGFYNLQLPSSWQSKLSELSNRQEGGTLTGVAVMGLLSALIVGPCVAPPLMGALIYIGQTGDPWLGGGALFALSMGMGAPLLAIGTAGGKFLPRAGAWMDSVKAVFGVLLLAVAIWMLERILPASVVLGLWAALFIISAVYLGALEPIREGASGWRKLWKGLGLVLLIYGIVLVIGMASGGRDPLSPLTGLPIAAMGAGAGGQGGPAQLQFQPVGSEAELEQALADAARQGQPVMLDFTADWCVTCKELERYTFTDPGVIQALAGIRTLKVDVTANNADDRALLRRFGLIGPPAILFWNGAGEELRNYRVVGFMDAERFRAHVRAAVGE